MKTIDIPLDQIVLVNPKSEWRSRSVWSSPAVLVARDLVRVVKGEHSRAPEGAKAGRTTSWSYTRQGLLVVTAKGRIIEGPLPAEREAAMHTAAVQLRTTIEAGDWATVDAFPQSALAVEHALGLEVIRAQDVRLTWAEWVETEAKDKAAQEAARLRRDAQLIVRRAMVAQLREVLGEHMPHVSIVQNEVHLYDIEKLLRLVLVAQAVELERLAQESVDLADGLISQQDLLDRAEGLRKRVAK